MWERWVVNGQPISHYSIDRSINCVYIYMYIMRCVPAEGAGARDGLQEGGGRVREHAGGRQHRERLDGAHGWSCCVAGEECPGRGGGWVSESGGIRSLRSRLIEDQPAAIEGR